MTEQARFHFDYVCGDTGLIDEQAEHQWFIENCCSITDLKKNWKTVCNKLNEVHKENEELKQENKTLKEENKHYKYVLRDLGLLISDKEFRDIRIEMADKIIKPLCKENGFDVDVDCTNGFTIIPKR